VPTKNVTPHRFGEALLLLAALIWGSGFILTKMALDAHMSAGQLMALRFTGATIFFGILFKRQLQHISRSEWLIGIGNGLLLFLGFMTQTTGLMYTTPSRNAFLTATYVVIVPFVSAVLLRRKPERRVVIGAIICFIGVAILSSPAKDALAGQLKGDLLTLACAVFYAVHLIALESAVRSVSVPKLIFLQMLTTAIMSLIFLPFQAVSVEPIIWSKAIPPVVYLIIFSSCLAYFLQISAQKRTTPARVAILLSAEALFGSVISVIFGFDAFSLNLLIGGLVIFASILLVEWPVRQID
jgi:drug/metabolite transporter (DMT)-like permease